MGPGWAHGAHQGLAAPADIRHGKPRETLELYFPIFNINLDVSALPNFPSPLALLQLNPALLPSSLFPKAARQGKTFPSSTTSPAPPNLPGKRKDSSKSSKPSGETRAGSGHPSGALWHLPKVQPRNMEQQQKSGKHLENAFFRNSTGGDPTHVEGLRSGAGLGGPTLTTESLDMRKCHLRQPSPVLGDTKSFPGGH